MKSGAVKVIEFCQCGSIKINGECTNKRCPALNRKSNKWIIKGVEYQFREKVTNEQAQEAVKNKSDLIIPRKRVSKPVAYEW